MITLDKKKKERIPEAETKIETVQARALDPWPAAGARLARGRSSPSARRAATRRGDCARSSTTWGPASSRPALARRPPSAAPVSPRPSLLSYFATRHLGRRRAPPGHQVFPPLGPPFLLREAVRPNPNIPFLIGSESNYRCICMYYYDY